MKIFLNKYGAWEGIEIMWFNTGAGDGSIKCGEFLEYLIERLSAF
jgi:hypothetical protein